MKALCYVDAVPAPGELVVVEGDEGFHAANVRRFRPGEEIDVSDGVGTIAACVVEHVAKARLEARVLAARLEAVPRPRVVVVQALPKSDRSELAIELATEAGADEFLGWQSERCVARWEGAERVQKGLRRWRSVARAAARQARRPRIPQVTGLSSTSDLLDRIGAAVAAGEVVLALHESAAGPLADVPFGGVDAVTLIVGPEGGLSDLEVAGLSAAGARLVTLGPTVLRTSTAAAVALGALGVLTPRWRRTGSGTGSDGAEPDGAEPGGARAGIERWGASSSGGTLS